MGDYRHEKGDYSASAWMEKAPSWDWEHGLFIPEEWLDIDVSVVERDINEFTEKSGLKGNVLVTATFTNGTAILFLGNDNDAYCARFMEGIGLAEFQIGEPSKQVLSAFRGFVDGAVTEAEGMSK